MGWLWSGLMIGLKVAWGAVLHTHHSLDHSTLTGCYYTTLWCSSKIRGKRMFTKTSALFIMAKSLYCKFINSIAHFKRMSHFLVCHDGDFPLIDKRIKGKIYCLNLVPEFCVMQFYFFFPFLVIISHSFKLRPLVEAQTLSLETIAQITPANNLI